jgi:hypothetical protein
MYLVFMLAVDDNGVALASIILPDYRAVRRFRRYCWSHFGVTVSARRATQDEKNDVFSRCR